MKNGPGRPRGVTKFACSFSLSQEMMSRLEEYQREHGLHTRTAALEHLIRRYHKRPSRTPVMAAAPESAGAAPAESSPE